MGSYKICGICDGPIIRNGVSIHNAIGQGFRKEGKKAHRYCLNKLVKGKVIKVNNYQTEHYILV